VTVEIPHQHEGVPREVVVDGVEQGAGLGGGGGVGAGGGDVGAGCEILLKLHNNDLDVVVEEAYEDGLGPVVLAWQNVGGLNDLVAAGHGVETFSRDSTLEYGEEEFCVELPHDILGVVLLAVDGNVEDAGAAGAVVLFNVVDAVLQVKDLAVLVGDQGLESSVFLLGGHEQGLQFVETGIGVAELVDNGFELGL